MARTNGGLVVTQPTVFGAQRLVSGLLLGICWRRRRPLRPKTHQGIQPPEPLAVGLPRVHAPWLARHQRRSTGNPVMTAGWTEGKRDLIAGPSRPCRAGSPR